MFLNLNSNWKLRQLFLKLYMTEIYLQLQNAFKLSIATKQGYVGILKVYALKCDI